MLPLGPAELDQIIRVYQPVRFEGRRLRPGNRDVEHPWTLIRREAMECSSQTLLGRGLQRAFRLNYNARSLACFHLLCAAIGIGFR